MGRLEIGIAWSGLALLAVSTVLLAWTIAAPDKALRPELAPGAVRLVPRPSEVLSRVPPNDDAGRVDAASTATESTEGTASRHDRTGSDQTDSDQMSLVQDVDPSRDEGPAAIGAGRAVDQGSVNPGSVNPGDRTNPITTQLESLRFEQSFAEPRNLLRAQGGRWRLVGGSRSLLIRESESLLVEGSEARVVEGSESLLIEGSEARLVEGSESFLVEGSEAAVVQGSRARVAKGSAPIDVGPTRQDANTSTTASLPKTTTSLPKTTAGTAPSAVAMPATTVALTARHAPTATSRPKTPASSTTATRTPPTTTRGTPPTTAILAPAPARSSGWLCPVSGHVGFSDGFGAPRSGGRSHAGIDMMAARGLPIVSPVAGQARMSSNNLGGKVVHLTAANGDYYYFAHLDSFGASGNVRAGTQLGTVGTTGNAASTPPHLHFEFHPGDNGPANPYRLLRTACG